MTQADDLLATTHHVLTRLAAPLLSADEAEDCERELAQAYEAAGRGDLDEYTEAADAWGGALVAAAEDADTRARPDPDLEDCAVSLCVGECVCYGQVCQTNTSTDPWGC